MTNNITYLTDITYESRIIEKLADEVIERISSWFDDGMIIDADEPNWAEDEELDEYLENRQYKIAQMVCQALLGRDKVVL